MADIVGIILGALSGSIGTQILTHRNTIIREERKLLREKGEDLVNGLLKISSWLTEKHNALYSKSYVDFKESKILLNNNFALQKLYFPSLIKEMDSVSGCFMELNSFTERKFYESEEIRISNPETDEYNKLLDDTLKSIEDFIDKIRNEINKIGTVKSVWKSICDYKNWF